jgi:hypothetical protein
MATILYMLHRRTVKETPASVIWHCACGFMTWRPPLKKYATPLQKAWDRHLARHTAEDLARTRLP